MIRPTLITLATASLAVAAPPQQSDFYKIEAFPLPEGFVVEVGSIATAPDETLYITGRRGDAWKITGGYADDLSKAQFSPWAEGLHEPFGAFWRDGGLVITQRSELTHVLDTNGDGFANRFRNINSDWGINGDYHEYAFGSLPDAEGNVYLVLCLTGSGGAADFSHWRGWTVKISPEGEMTPFASGVRSPGGIGWNAAGDLFYTDNQGPWNGSSALKWIKPGGFNGSPAGNKYHKLAGLPQPPVPTHTSKETPKEKMAAQRLITEHERDPRIVPHAVIFPHGKVGQSPTAVITDDSEGKFGPFAGQVFVGEQTHSQIQRVDLEMVNGFYQGAVFPFLEGFGSGIVPMAQGPDGTFFAGGTNRGWGSRGPEPFALERVRWTGKTPFEIHTMRATPTGFKLTFTEPVDAKTAADPASYAMKAWTYIYQPSYGSPEVDHSTPKITQAVVADDNLSVTLTIEGLVRGNVHHLVSKGVRSANGNPLWHSDAYYTLNNIPAAK